MKKPWNDLAKKRNSWMVFLQNRIRVHKLAFLLHFMQSEAHFLSLYMEGNQQEKKPWHKQHKTDRSHRWPFATTPF